MDQKKIVVTGAAGFIGSCLVAQLNQLGWNNIVLVDDFRNERKTSNWKYKNYSDRIERKDFWGWIEINHSEVSFIFHLGARTDTTEFDYSIFEELNVDYSQKMWKACAEYKIPLVYASSAATYGLGELGYQDSHDMVPHLKPLNPYGESKNNFDVWALRQTSQPPFWAGLKFFNVYGPNEYHKGRMASVIFHAFNQIQEKAGVKLFRSHRDDYQDGEQLRDFVYVKDVVNVCVFLMENQPDSGIYNLGSGKARTFKSLAEATFAAVGKEVNISYVDTPADIRDKYQYFTEADMSKLLSAGYSKSFHSLEEGINDYVQSYLIQNSYF